MTGDCFGLEFHRRSVNGKYLMRFQNETSVFKSRRSVNRALSLANVDQVQQLFAVN